jgi:hypothetical protein
MCEEPVNRSVVLLDGSSLPALTFLAASSPDTTASVTTPDLGASDRNSIGFLLNCPGETDFMREFPKDNTLSPQSQGTEFSSLAASHNGYEQMGGEAAVTSRDQFHGYGQGGMESNLGNLLKSLQFENFEQSSHNWQIPGDNIIMLPAPGGMFMDRAVLEQRAYDIRDKLRYTASTLNSPNAPPNGLLDAIEQITALKIASWIKLFFKNWHKHGPMVHEASFNPCTAALPLVLALMCIGGMVSSSEILVIGT